MAVKVYRSTDASAPVLTGQVGSLTSLLKACLVDGYGALAAAGWTNPFSGTNQRVFRPGSGVQHYFHVDDNSPDATAAAKEGQIAGSETATAWRTGTNFFPTTVQETESGVVIRKSATADATARPWIVIADDRTCYVLVQTGDSAGFYMGASFGEIYSLLTVTDSFRSHVIARPTKNSALVTVAAELLSALAAAANSAVLAAHYIARAYTGLGTSQTARKWGDSARAAISANAFAGSSGLTLPEPVTGALHVAPIHINETSNTVRGRLRGLFHLCHIANPAMSDGDTITGAGAYVGRTFLVVKGGTTYALLFDITGPWETN